MNRLNNSSINGQQLNFLFLHKKYCNNFEYLKELFPKLTEIGRKNDHI